MPPINSLKLLRALAMFLSHCCRQLPFYKKAKTLKALDFPIGRLLQVGFYRAGLIHMLGDASSTFTESGIDYPLPLLIAGLCFEFFFG